MKGDRRVNRKNTPGMKLQLNMAEYEAEMREFMKQKEKQLILKQHKAAWPWWQNTKNRWVTYVPDASKPNGRRQLSANMETDLEDKVVRFYKEAVPDASTLTLRILYPEWIEWKRDYGVSKNGRIKPQTIKRNRKDWKRYFENSEIVDKPLSSLGPDELKLWVFDMITAYDMDKHQFANFHSIIFQMFAYAVKQGYLRTNPFDKIDDLWAATNEKEPRPDEEMAFLPEEHKPLIDYCWEQYNNDRYLVQKFVPLAVVFSFYTGLRNGELAALRFSDIHSDGLVVQRSVDDDHHVVNRTKGGRKRTVPLIPDALALIEEVKRKRLEMGLPIDGYIFSVDDDPFRVYVRIREAVGKYCEELGLPRRSHHAIRRTFISMCLTNGLTAREVMDYVGHKEFSTTEKNYFKNLFKPNEKASRLEQALAN